MTIALAIKVNDGIVMAADSRASYAQMTGNGPKVIHSFDNAVKIVNLHKRLPIGMVTSGVGGMGSRSISTIAKDFRELISGNDPRWAIDVSDYTVKDIVDRFHEYVYHDAYLKAFPEPQAGPASNFIIAGYSSRDLLPEVWKLEYNGGQDCCPLLQFAAEDVGASWIGDGEALSRLILGYGRGLPHLLSQMGFLSIEQIGQIMRTVGQTLQMAPYSPGMPIQDAIHLAEFLVSTTATFTRYIPGGATVGGPTEIAAITRHEKFKWVARKHYFDKSLNT